MDLPARDKVLSLVDLLGISNPIARAMAPAVEAIMGLRQLTRFYRRLPRDLPTSEFLDAVFHNLETSIDVNDEEAERIPESGPVIVVSNHPFGGIEGLALARVLLRRRPDIRIMANYLLGRFPELADLFILVNPFDTKGAAQFNFKALRETIRWVAGDRLLAVFPAGEVASLNLKRRQVVDPPWDPTIARVIRRAGCPVIPVFFPGRNDAFFQLLGLIHPRLRTLMLARELTNKRRRRLRIRIGSPIAPRSLTKWATDHELAAYLQMRTEVLGERDDEPRLESVMPGAPVRDIIAPIAVEILADEIEALDEGACLVSTPKAVVYAARAEQIPNILKEIGRLRELTFRAVGEGTGRELDLDDFDQRYLHLFIWNPEDQDIVGAYRLGHSDLLLEESGLQGLYSSTLFRFDPALFAAMGPSLEMGRSFITPKYQKSLSGLMMLWKGIGAYVCRHPQYAHLFGPVSISADYSISSQKLIVDSLNGSDYGHSWAQWVRPRTPFAPRRRCNFLPNPAHLRSISEISEFISEIESDGKGVPILIKQYFKLGGRVLGFNVDPDFSNVLDLLVLVDLRETPAGTLNKYMGRENAARFLEFHS